LTMLVTHLSVKRSSPRCFSGRLSHWSHKSTVSTLLSTLVVLIRLLTLPDIVVQVALYSTVLMTSSCKVLWRTWSKSCIMWLKWVNGILKTNKASSCLASVYCCWTKACAVLMMWLKLLSWNDKIPNLPRQQESVVVQNWQSSLLLAVLSVPAMRERDWEGFPTKVLMCMVSFQVVILSLGTWSLKTSTDTGVCLFGWWIKCWMSLWDTTWWQELWNIEMLKEMLSCWIVDDQS
jgi:hypothetical protein